MTFGRELICAAGAPGADFSGTWENLVVDAADGSLFQALQTAAQLLDGSDCDFMLAGAVNSVSDPLAAWATGYRPRRGIPA